MNNASPRGQPRIYETDDEIVWMLYGSTYQAALANVVGAVFIVYLMFDRVAHDMLYSWGGFLLAITAFRLAVNAGFARNAPHGEALRPWRTLFMVNIALVGAAWGFAAYFFIQPDDPMHQALITLTVTAFLAGALSTVSMSTPAYLALFVPGMLPLMLRTLALGGEVNQGMAVMLVVFSGFIISAARRLERKLRHSLELRFENAGLLAELREQGEITQQLNASLMREVEHRRQSEASLIQAHQRAEAANIAKSAFLANMSHEIRTPLNAITGMAHLIRRGGVTPEQADRLNKIDAAGRHLLEILNAVLDLSKIEAGKFSLESAPLDINWLLADVASMIGEKARDKGLDVVVERLDLGARVLGDATRLQQALLNYASNAVKFTEHGQIVLRARLEAESDADLTLRFEVEDTGIGIDAADLPRLFSAFEQADNSTTRRYGGTGLGLAITRKLAELAGGSAGARGEPGKGSVFWFTARLTRAGMPVMPATRPGPDKDAEGLCRQHAGKHVLLVEDEPVNSEVAQMLLAEAGLASTPVGDGLAALGEAVRMRYDVVLMDMQMPVMDGLEATRRLRRLPGYATTPIIAMTANAFAEDRQRCFDAGMNDFLPKPIVPADLFKALQRALDEA